MKIHQDLSSYDPDRHWILLFNKLSGQVSVTNLEYRTDDCDIVILVPRYMSILGGGKYCYRTKRWTIQGGGLSRNLGPQTLWKRNIKHVYLNAREHEEKVVYDTLIKLGQ